MNLTEMFYGTWMPPIITSTRIHKLGFASLPSYIPSKVKPSKENMTFEERLSISGKKALKSLRAQIKPITSSEMAKKTSLSLNFCSSILYTFVKEGLATRTKIKKPNTYVYAYKAIKND